MISVDKIYVITEAAEDALSDTFLKMLEVLPWKAEVQHVRLIEVYHAAEEDGDGPEQDADTGIELARTHWSIWQQAMRESLHCIVVLHSNIRVSKTHFHILDTEETWDMIYLGREAFAVDEPVAGGLVIPGFSDGTFAYILRRSGLTKLMSSGLNHQWIGLQDFLGAIQGVHPDPVVAGAFSADLQVLAPMSNFVDTVEKTITEVDGYTPLHPSLFDVDSPLWAKRYLNPQIADKEYDLICDEPIVNVYSFPLFTDYFCKEMIEEAEHYGHWTNYRYKDDHSRASIDLMLTSIGFHDAYKKILRKYVQPLFQHKYQLDLRISDTLDSQHFVVRYLADEQRHLGLHNDACDISMIVTLNKDFEGGGTFFPKFGKLIRHEYPGYASIHPGFVGYTHGARPTTRGKRYILASFFFRV